MRAFVVLSALLALASVSSATLVVTGTALGGLLALGALKAKVALLGAAIGSASRCIK